MSLGAAIRRVDGPEKVQGSAIYVGDQQPPHTLYAVVVQSTVAVGRIRSIDHAVASAMPGVVRIFTHLDFPKLNKGTLFPHGSLSQSYLPLQGDRISFYGQHIALALAETLHECTEAARHVIVEYTPDEPVADLSDPRAKPLPAAQTSPPSWVQLDTLRGTPAAVFAAAPVRIEATYTTPRHQHCPIEPHGTVAIWQEDTGFTVWEPTQWPEGARVAIAEWTGVPIEKVRVISPYIGGGFGAKVESHPHVALACAAARALGRPVKLMLSRAQTFTGHGARPATRQAIRLSANPSGQILSMAHECMSETSFDDCFIEAAGAVGKFMYRIPNLSVQQRVTQVNAVTPTTMRAPGYSVGAFALESALDELAVALDLDPLVLRLRNYAESDQQSGRPWSTCQLREAYRIGADAFGWSRRSNRSRTMRDGRQLIGWGMAAGAYPVYLTPAEVCVRIEATGRVVVETSGTDLGTGTYTILAQTAADAIGVPVDHVIVRLGDTALPRAPITAGSQLANTLTAAVDKVGRAARKELLSLVTESARSPLFNARANDVDLIDGEVVATGAGISMPIAEVLRHLKQDGVTVTDDTMPPDANSEADRHATFRTATRTVPPSDDYVSYSWGVQFAEVRVDEDFGTAVVSRLLGVFDCGRLYNPRLAMSQWRGGMIMGIGQALLEALDVDRLHAKVVNDNLADYLVPVAADIPDIELLSVGQPDLHASPLGGKSVGEIGIIGTSAAIANAIFHATGKRVRDLPIRMEDLF